MVKSADKLAFITGNDKYLTGVEGSFPVLVKSVREEFCCFRYRHYYAMNYEYEERNRLFQGNWIDTAEEIDDLFLGDAEVTS